MWLAEVPILDVATQGKSRKNAQRMIADAIESLVNKPGFHVEVFDCGDQHIQLGSPDTATLTAFLLRRQREARGLSLADVSKRLGQSSRNAYARYEQGKTVPTVDKLQELLAVVAGSDFVLSPA